tara:strand:+ start:44 stop:883 length:840 start_codon:yes stop_codon:yes gene_type:complete
MIEIKTDVGIFTVEPHLKENIDKNAISIALVSHLSPDMTINAINSFKKYSDIPIEIFVVDNFSDDETVKKLKEIDDINLILNKGDFRSILNGHKDSVLNGVGVDIASRFIESKYMFVCHNDVMAYKKGWLNYLVSKLDDKTRGAAFCKDNGRILAMHVSGYLLDLDLYKKLGPNWYPAWENGSMYLDVGDHYTQALRDANYDYFICPNTHNNPELLSGLNDVLIEKHDIFADKALSDSGEILYLHLGRGILKSAGRYSKPGRTNYDTWVKFGLEKLSSE